MDTELTVLQLLKIIITLRETNRNLKRVRNYILFLIISNHFSCGYNADRAKTSTNIYFVDRNELQLENVRSKL